MSGTPMVSRHPRRCGGAYVLAGTRMKVSVIWYLHWQGYAVEEIIGPHWYPHLTREQVETAIAWGEKRSDAARRGWARRRDRGGEG